MENSKGIYNTRNPKIVIVILNWNGFSLTRDCLLSIQAIDVSNYSIVLVDNGSALEDLSKLKEFITQNYPRRRIIKQKEIKYLNRDLLLFNRDLCLVENETNLGFAAGNNIGIKLALSHKTEYVLLLNNDTIVDKYFLIRLLNFMESYPEYVACTPKILLDDPKDRIWNCGGKITWFGNRRYYFAGQQINKSPQVGTKDITFITGCALFFKPNKTGILSEDFFFGEEDFEFSLRQKKNNQKMACVYDSIIYHRVGGTYRNNDSQGTFMGRFYIHYVTRFMDLRSYYSTVFWHFLRIINFLYAFFLVAFRYRLPFRENFRLWKMIFRDSKVKKTFRREDFYRARKLTFK